MTDAVMIRETARTDETRVLALYPMAFPDEELRPVVAALIAAGSEVLSLAAFKADALIGHVLFTRCGTAGRDRSGALLGPLCVEPLHQGQGLGGALVRNGLERLATTDVRQVFVLGDPVYYRRFGFAPERRVSPPYPLPDAWSDAWRSLRLAGRARLSAGRLSLPTPWMNQGLWAP